MSGRASHPGGFRSTYEVAFVRHCHELIGLAYDRLNAAELIESEEAAITGHLVDKIKAVTDDPHSPRWVVHYWPSDDEPKSIKGKTGKRRPRADISLARTTPRPASKFIFEAKRLGDSSPLSAYLGDDGMIALIAGHYGEHPTSGMIGYVQSGTCDEWSRKIKDAIQKTPEKYYAVTPATFHGLGVVKPKHVFRTEHRSKDSTPRSVTHTLLLFHPVL